MDPLIESMNIWCEGCGEVDDLVAYHRVEVDGRIVMLCERCYWESADG